MLRLKHWHDSLSLQLISVWFSYLLGDLFYYVCENINLKSLYAYGRQKNVIISFRTKVSGF